MSNIAFFLSSTFNDMQSERDLIRECITPEIEQELKKYGHNIEFIDLRWGIDTKGIDESAAGGKILQTCFDEIRKTRPFFIAFIGERYGWIPEQDDVDAVCRDNGLAGDDYLKKSVTELEIACAMHSYPFMDKCLFYFREPVEYGDDSAARAMYVSEGAERRKLDALKAHLKKKYPSRVHTYKADWNTDEQKIEGLESFERQLLADLRQCLDEEFSSEKPSNRWEESANCIESAISSAAAAFSGRTDELERVDAFLRNDTERVLYLCGDSGCGKSALMAEIAAKYNDGRHIVLPFFAGAAENTFTAESLMALTVYRLCKLFGTRPCFDPDGEIEDYAAVATQFSYLLNRAAADKQTVLVVDALNQLAATAYEERLRWLNLYAIAPTVKIIISATTDYRQSKYVRALGAAQLDLDSFSNEDIADVARRYFTVNHKELNDSVLYEIVHKDEGTNPCRRPLYLMSLLQELNNIGREDFAEIKRRESALHEDAADAIVGYLADTVRCTPNDLFNQMGKVFDRVAQKVGEEACKVFACSIAVSRRGLSERYIERICRRIGCEFTTAAFSYFRKLFKNYLCQRENGAWDYNHNLIKSYFAERFKELPLYKEVLHAAVDTLTEEDDSDFKRSEFAYFLSLDKRLDLFVPYFCAHSDDITVRSSLVAVTQQLQREGQNAVDGLLFPVSDNTVIIWDFFTQSIRSGLYEPKAAESYAHKVLCSVYSTPYAQSEAAIMRIGRVYAALGTVAVSSGYYKAGRDYLHMARALADKANDTSVCYETDALLSSCYFALGNELKRRKYALRSERALESRVHTAPAQEDISMLLHILYNQCMQKADGVFVRSGAVSAILRKMHGLLNQNILPQAETALWYARILYVGTHIRRSDTDLFTRAESVCREYASAVKEGKERAEILYLTAVWQAETDMAACDALLAEAHENVLRELRGDESTDMLILLDKICEAQCLSAQMQGKNVGEIKSEQAEVLRKINLLQPDYGTLCRAVSGGKHGDFSLSDKELDEMINRRREVAKGQVSAEQKAANKILLLIAAVVLAVFVVLMPLFFSFFRADAMVFFHYSSAYSMFVNFYLQAMFETCFQLCFCFGVYGLMQVFRIGNDYKIRSVWIKRCTVLFAAAALVLAVYCIVWKYFESRLLITGGKTLTGWLIPYLSLIVCGMMLAAQLCNEAFTFVTRELPVRQPMRRYTRFVKEYRNKMLTYCVNLAFVAVTVLIYCLAARPLMAQGRLTLKTGPIFGLPVLWFVVCAVGITVIEAAKMIYLTVAYFVTKEKYGKNATH